jgi:hypothetical protein
MLTEYATNSKDVHLLVQVSVSFVQFLHKLCRMLLKTDFVRKNYDRQWPKNGQICYKKSDSEKCENRKASTCGMKTSEA